MTLHPVPLWSPRASFYECLDTFAQDEPFPEGLASNNRFTKSFDILKVLYQLRTKMERGILALEFIVMLEKSSLYFI